MKLVKSCVRKVLVQGTFDHVCWDSRVLAISQLSLIFHLGCLPDYEPECVDKSDVFLCSAKDCNHEPGFFLCKDEKYCIKKSLVCDGYAQCEDESGMIYNHDQHCIRVPNCLHKRIIIITRM